MYGTAAAAHAQDKGPGLDRTGLDLTISRTLQAAGCGFWCSVLALLARGSSPSLIV